MNKKPKNIEQLFSESFSDFRVEPSSGLWKSISSKLAWRNFFTFNPTTLNAYYLTGILALATAGVLWITKPVTENNQNINEITINKTEESQKSEVGSRKQEDSIKTKVKSKKIKVKDEDQLSEKEMKPVPKPTSSTEVLTKMDTQKLSSSAIVTAKAEIQESIPSIKHVSPRTQYPLVHRSLLDSRSLGEGCGEGGVPSTHEPVTPKLATPHPKPTQHPLVHRSLGEGGEPSTMFQDPWPNIDSLFTNNTPTPPEYTIEFPNAFTPNLNGPTNGYYTPGIPNNDVFHPVYKGVVEYHLRIFNRRGELIFESNEINIGWDGYINDRLAAQGVYVWKAKGKYSNGQSFTKVGNIMLIKK